MSAWAPRAASSACSSSAPGASGPQHQVPYAVPFDEVPGQQGAQATGAAGDEDGAGSGPGRGHGQDDLADVLGLLQEPQRLGGAGDVERGHRDRPQHALLEQFQQGGQHLTDTVATRFDEVERLVRHAVFGGHFTGVPDVGLAHLDEPATGLQQS